MCEVLKGEARRTRDHARLEPLILSEPGLVKALARVAEAHVSSPRLYLTS